MLQLHCQDQPRVFSLSYANDNGPSICLGIFTSCVDALIELCLLNGAVEHQLRTWKFKEGFSSDLPDEFGFNGVMREHSCGNGYLFLEAPLTKENSVAIAVTLSMLFKQLIFLEKDSKGILKVETDKTRLQLLSVNCWLEPRATLNRAPTGAVASPAFASWVAEMSQKQSSLQEVEKVMCEAWNAMSSPSEGTVRPSSFRAHLTKKGGFYLDVIGNGCRLYSESRYQNEGYKLGGHNIESSVQQLCLIAGLAKMHDLASKDLDKKPPS